MTAAPWTTVPWTTAPWRTRPVVHQPDWSDHPDHARVREALVAAEPLVTHGELDELRAGLAQAAAGRAFVVQAGDCAESFYESTAEHTARRLDALDALADRVADRAGGPVLRVGRIGGQYAKPRSRPADVVDGVTLPSFRGHLVHSDLPTPPARRPDPRRLLWGLHFAEETHRALRARRAEQPEHDRRRPDAPALHRGPWASHEALLLDYDGALVRTDAATGRWFLGSTHLPWLGARSCDPHGAHVALLGSVVNPVAMKVGPDLGADTLTALCAALDPDREPGRLTLVVRLGADAVGEALPPLVRAVGSAGHPVTWLSDPMHGNTVRTACGRKTRHLSTMVAETRAVAGVLAAHGTGLGGLHLETAVDAVTECVGGAVRSEQDLAAHYTSLCDPRLTGRQAAELVDRVFS